MTAKIASGIKLRQNGCLQRLARAITQSMEQLFYRVGYFVGDRPWLTLLLTLVTCGILGSGIVFWREERETLALWTTEDSDVRLDARWVESHFSDNVRYESVIITADNILRTDVLLFIAEIDQMVKNITTQEGHGWTDVCARYGSSLKQRKRKRDTSSLFQSLDIFNQSGSSAADFGFLASAGGFDDLDLAGLDFSNVLGADGQAGSLLGANGEQLMDLIAGPDDCLFRSILQAWNNDPDRIRNNTLEKNLQVLNDVIRRSANLSYVESVVHLLSDISRDEQGHVTRAGATLVTWMLDNKQNSSLNLAWEKEFINRTVNSGLKLPPGVKMYPLASRSYDDALADTLNSNLVILLAGFSLIIFYIAVTLGRFNSVEQRCLMAIVGVTVVGLAIVASYGFCFYCGVFYGPVHPILPFLLLGIGVDDIFVFIQALDNLNEEERRHSVPERIGLAMKHAGVSITVTSVTDIVAFGIGSTTGVPALRSFCINATAGIFFLFLLVITFFAAVTALDELRKESRRDGFCFRKKPEKWQPSECSRRELLRLIFEKFYGPFLLKTPVKVIVLVITAIFVAVNSWGVMQLERNFDPNWYLKEGSYPLEFFDAMKRYFPENGEYGAVYTGRLNYLEEVSELNRMIDLLRNNAYIKPSSVSFWHEDFQFWLNSTKKVEYPSDGKNFKLLLQEFLFTLEGRQYLQDIKVEGSILDLDANYNITASRVRFRHVTLENSTAKNSALESIMLIKDEILFGDSAQPRSPVVFAYIYVEWEANKVISNELIRNVGLTLVAVLIVTLVLIADLVAVLWVFTCIAFTLVDVLGLMYFWGLTVEIVTSIIIILSAGLAVDYAAHIGHTFTTLYGSKSTRAKVTLTRMGPAVWNGGLSTFLAFVLLANSDTYVFTTFFKLFFSVVVFGLFHGLAYLPVILSWFGPAESVDPSDASGSSSPQPSIYILGYDNFSFLPDGQFAKRSAIVNRILMDKNRSSQRGSSADEEPPFIPQPDYTPLPRRREAPLVDGKSSAGRKLNSIQESESDSDPSLGPQVSRPMTDVGPRVWHHPQWASASSQFDARKWSSALAKRLSMEAQQRHADRDKKIRHQIGAELDRFESEMDSYLENTDSNRQESGSQTPVTSNSLTPVASGSPSSSPKTRNSASASPKPTRDEDYRDHESLESGYMSSYPGRRY